MKQLLCVIHPYAFQATSLISSMQYTPTENKENIQSYSFQNLEWGALHTNIATNEKHSIWAMIDGEITNIELLKKELKEKGMYVQPKSMADIIVAAYEVWGESFLTKLSGPFALFLFDETTKTILVARDHIGQKPLYWGSQGQYFLISTQIKSLLATGVIPQTAALDSLASFLYFGFIPQDLSPIKGVYKLLPGHYLKVDLKQEWHVTQYWSLGKFYQTKQEISKEEALNTLEKLLKQTIHDSTVYNEKSAILLSPSLGDSSLAWLAAHERNKPNFTLLTARLSHSPAEENFSKYIEYLGIPHLSYEITAKELFDHLVSMVWAIEEPIADPHLCTIYTLSKKSAEHNFSSCLTSLGFEEIMGGSLLPLTKEENFQPFIKTIASLPHLVRDCLILPLCKFFGIENSSFRILRNIDINQQQINYLNKIALFKGSNRKKVSPKLHHYFDPEIFTQRFHRLSQFKNPTSSSHYFDSKTTLPDATLLEYEKLFGANETKLISPFLSHKIMEFMASLPDSITSGTTTADTLLPQLMKRLDPAHPPLPLPEENTFYNNFYSNPLFKEHFDLLKKSRIVEEGYLSIKWLNQQLNYPYRVPYIFKELWSLLIFEIWFRLFINTPIGSQDPKVSVKELLE